MNIYEVLWRLFVAALIVLAIIVLAIPVRGEDAPAKPAPPTAEQISAWDKEMAAKGIPDYIYVALDVTVIDTIQRRTYNERRLTLYSRYAYILKYGKFQETDYFEYLMKGTIVYSITEIKAEI